MYLKKIKAHGFKSFADKINIELDTKLTGIVGPNGSGKSNIVDAVRWVLGEQSVKSLRGDTSMTDIIFSGSKSRNPLNVASVTLVLDNSDNYLPLAFNEISIQRRVYKDGSNEYYLNNEKCRLKDILDLLVDSGFGKDSLNIISQGEVESIISSKPTDRRVLIEEAAGVLKYKKRKEESLSKLSKTHDNIERINLIIRENSENLEPLSVAAKKAREYKDALSELESVEIALIAKDINTYSEEVEIKKDTKLKREEELSLIDTDNTKGSTEVEKIKLNILDLDNKIKETSTNIFKINENLIELSNKKTLLMERIKYDKESSEVQNNLIVLKDREGSINNLISSLKFDIGNLKNNKNDLDTKVNDNNFVYKEVLNEREKVNFELNNERKKLIETKNKIDILESNISNMSKIPYAVKAIVGNPTLRGIHDIIANVISTEREYSVMLDIALGASANNIITNDEACAKEAIEYLKSHNKGRATFFPLNVIKPKSVDPETLKSVSNIVGFVGIASDLVTYDTKYYNIVMNQLGNIIVAKDITTAIQISKKINHRYRVISLDGEIIHVGGIMTGGSVKSNNSYITDKYELERLKISIDNINNNIKELDVKLDSKDKELDIIKNKNYSINIEIIKVNEEINNKVTLLRDKVSELESINNEIKNLTDESLDNELNNIINEYYENEKLKNEQEKLLDKYNNDKNELNISLNDLETAIKKSNQEYISLKNEISSLEIDITKLNMNLDNLLNRLNEDYNLGYERARSEYTLEIEENIAREKVSNLRRKIKSLGDVNLGSIDEYDRIYKRVTFLTKQKEDLEKSQSDLLNIIDDMDNVMKDKFVTSFNNINTEFGKVFNTLFKGGSAHLELTDPDNIFETGIDIIAVPPGKNKKPLSLLSGGERTMTAISLLFSIMNLEKVPFVILDEVESALDENNATIFGEYLDNYKNKTQLLVITHKKKTMEFLDKLYGITMQESGVSKIVSVKLED